MSNSAVTSQETTAEAPTVRPGNHTVLPGQTPTGEHILAVLIKRTYDIAANRYCMRADADKKLVSGDQHYGDPMNSTVELEADFVPFKLQTDVVLNGLAYAPGGSPTETLRASLQVGEHRKDIQVIGDRECRYREGGLPSFTDPTPFTEMEIRYERAYGGVDIYSDRKVPCVYARNYLGRGFAVSNTKEAVDHLPLPNIEEPDNLLTPEGLCPGHFMHWERQPMPAGLGWFSKYWQPRAALAGVMPADRPVERELRAVYAKAIPPEQKALYDQTELPDMDFRFFNGASQGLAVPYLNGNEGVRLIHLTPDGDTSFWLPDERPAVGLDIGSGVKEPEVVLHTVMIRIPEAQVDLTWRGAVPYPGPEWLPQMRKMEVLIQ